MIKIFKFTQILVVIFCYQIIFCSIGFAKDQDTSYIPAINLPQSKDVLKPKKSIVIAIVDDGVRISHKDIKTFIWQNPAENPENGMDDDGNGFVNDINGWDVADSNNSVEPPVNTRFDFYHGTHLAGIITNIAKSVYTENADDFLKIMPVKVISDRAVTSQIKHGYEGIEYAINAGADIILTAWSVNRISEFELKIIKLAKEKGILIVAAGGNLSTNKKQYPAAVESVLSVAALDNNYKKIKESNFGDYIDISAPGKDITSSSFNSDDGYEMHTGTSQASAIIATVAAIVRMQNPNYSWEQVKACIKNSADQVDIINQRYGGKLGAGAVNLTNALACKSLKEPLLKNKEFKNPQGFLNLSSNKNSKLWTIKPNGQFKGINFKTTSFSGNLSDALISFHKGDSADKPPYIQYPLNKLPDNFQIPGTAVTIQLTTQSAINGLIEYKVDPIDFTKLFCEDTKYLKSEGVIEDGSGDENYSYNSSCKWLITAPKGNVIRFEFTELSTESKVDKIYFFNGEGTQEKIMIILSGNRLPPAFNTWSNKVLVWFVTDEKNQQKGWKATYSFHPSSKK